MKLSLYHYWRSSSSWRVRWALAIKGVNCSFHSVNLLNDETESPEHLKRNPHGYVPVLEIQNSATDIAYLSESVAILEWLEETFPKSPNVASLYPGPPLNRARIRQLCEVINAGTQPLQNLNVLHLHSNDPQEQKKWAQYWIRKGLHAYETLAAPWAGRFSVGNDLSAADLFLIPQLYNARRQEIAIEEFPLLAKIFAECAQTLPYQASEPDRFKPNETALK